MPDDSHERTTVAHLEELIASLWRQNRERVLGDIQTLENTVTSWLSESLQPEERRAAERIAHKLAGGLGTYGFMEGSRLAKEIELALEGDEDPDQHEMLNICATVLSLTEEMQKERAPQLGIPTTTDSARVEPGTDANRDIGSTPFGVEPPTSEQPSAAEYPAFPENAPDWQEPSPQSEHVDIVVVDDDPILVELLVQSLKIRGYEVRSLNDGQAAVEQLAGQPPLLSARLIVLDVDMPGMDGLSVLTRLSREKVLADTQVLMLTARSTETEMLRAFKLGAKDHVSKPFSLPVLTERVRRLLGD